MNLIAIASDRFHATVSPLGAELQSLTGQDGTDYLWDGDAATWTGRSPILFPVVGALSGGAYRWQGAAYPLEKHGFARRSRFAVVDHDRASATLRLTADDASRIVYPFEFALELNYALGDELVVTATVSNEGDGPMPFSFGFHPAVRISPGATVLAFGRAERGPVCRIDADGLLDRTEPLPGDGESLVIGETLFAQDAMILRGTASRSAVLRTGGRTIEFAWDNLPDLALWKKPGAAFLCVEPWAGHSDPARFAGSIEDKPGIVMLPPGKRWMARLRMRASGA